MIREILEWVVKLRTVEVERVHDLAQLSATNRLLHEATTCLLFKKVYLRPQSREEKDRKEPCVLRNRCADAVEIVVCKYGDSCGDRFLDIDGLCEALSNFRNLRSLSVEDNEFLSSGIDVVLERLGSLPTPPFPVLKYIEAKGISPAILTSQHTIVERLSLSCQPTYFSPNLRQVLAKPFSALQWLTLDGDTLLVMEENRSETMFYDSVKNIRILLSALEVAKLGMEFN